MQICDDDCVEVFRSKSCDHAWKIGKAILIYGEWTILLLVIDVQVDDVGGDVGRAQTICGFKHARLRREAVAGLLKPPTPQGRKSHCARKPPISPDDLPRP